MSKIFHLMPFSAEAVIAYHSMKRRNFNIGCFFDNAGHLNGKVYCETPIQVPHASDDSRELVVVLCDRRYSAKNRIQMESLGYTDFADIKDIVCFTDAEQAVSDVDVSNYFDLIPSRRNLMKEQLNQYEAVKPCCLLCNGEFAVSVPLLYTNENKCTPICPLFRSTRKEDNLISYIEGFTDGKNCNDKMNRQKRVVAFFAKYPLDKARDGFLKAILATDELFKENCYRIYFEAVPYESCVHGVEMRDNGNGLAHASYYRYNDKHIQEVRAILGHCDLIYIHSVYKCEEEILSDIEKPAVLEVHGAVPEELKYMGAPSHVVNNAAKKEEFAFQVCGKIICRNDSMADYYSQKYDFPMENIIKLPSMSEFSLPVAEHLIKEININEQLNIHAPVCMIYSGGTSKWQMIPTMIEGISKRPEYKYIIATGETDAFKKLTTNLTMHDIEILYVQPEQLEPVYRRAQYGFVLREGNIVNRVACPTKLVEYCAFGVVPVMLSGKIGDFDKYGLKFVRYDDFLTGQLPDEDTRFEMAEQNYQIARKMAAEYKVCKRELLKHIFEL